MGRTASIVGERETTGRAGAGAQLAAIRTSLNVSSTSRDRWYVAYTAPRGNPEHFLSSRPLGV